MGPEWIPVASVLTRLETGKRPAGGDDAGAEGIPSLGGENLTRTGELSIDGVRRVPQSYFRRMHQGVLRPGDVLLNKDGAQTGKVGRYRGEFPDACINEHLFLLRARPELCLPEYLFWSMRAPQVQRQIERHITGSAQPGLGRGFASRVLIRIPPISQQHDAIEPLEAVTRHIDLISASITKLRKLRRGVLESSIAEFGATSHGKRLASLTTQIVDGVHHTPMYVERGVPFLTVENLTRGEGISLDPVRYVSERAHATYRKRIEPLPGDVLVSKDGTLGVARLVPPGFPEASVFVSVAVIRPLQNVVVPDFLRLFFGTSGFERQLGALSAGTGLRHIHLEHFREFVIPGLTNEQQRLVVERVTKIERLIASSEAKLAKMRLLETGLMAEASGDLGSTGGAAL